MKAEGVPSIAVAAKQYRERGFHTIRLRPRSKRPIGTGWQSGAEPDTDFGNGENVGIVLGQKSGGLVDIDLDSPESIHLARLFFDDLPSFGRESSRESHRVAICNDLPTDAKVIRLPWADSQDVLIELRASGGQTVFPPSIHEGTGETVEWTFGSSPDRFPELDWETLKFNVGLIAFLAIVERNYPRSSGSRDDICLALAGSLLNMGVDVSLVDRIIVDIASRCGDEEAEQRAKARQTHDKRASGVAVTGLPKLCDLLSLDIQRVGKLLATTGVTTKSATSQDQIYVGDCAEAAEKFIELERPTLMHLAGDWYAFHESCYRMLEDRTVKSELFKFLAKVRQPGNMKTRWIPYKRTRSAVGDVLQSLESSVHRPRDTFSPPCWLSEREHDPETIIACRNGLLHLPTQVLSPPDKNFFTVNALDFEFDPTAKCPEWGAFLDQLFPSREPEQRLLQEIFGYMLVPDMSQEKIFLLVSPKRGGKGTVNGVLRKLIGENNCVSPSLHSMAGDFGLAPLIGKQLASISDMRMSHRTDHGALVENLLRLSGRDSASISRKHKDNWEGHLKVRFLILTNPPLEQIRDPSGVLASRLVPIKMTESFFGREDRALGRKLAAELPGILNWAIQGWSRLNERGYFDLPPSSEQLIRHVSRVNNPVSAFLDERCEFDTEATLTKNLLFEAYKEWCEDQGIRSPMQKNRFLSAVYAASEDLVRPYKPGPKQADREPRVRGLRLIEPQNLPF